MSDRLLITFIYYGCFLLNTDGEICPNDLR